MSEAMPDQASVTQAVDLGFRAATEPQLAATAEETVTVVIPARNEADHIEAALTSVARQHYPLHRLEAVVVDNGSTDGTAELALGFAARHPELRVTVVNEPTAGVSLAKNRGAQVASGSILIFLDADSRMDPDVVRDVVAKYREGSRAGSIRVVADSQNWLERGFFDLMELGQVLFSIRTQMMYCDRALFLSLKGYRPELHLAEDLEFLKRVKASAARARANGHEPVCHIRSSVISTSPRRLRELPFHLSIVTVFLRWALAFIGVGRRSRY